MPTFFRLFGFGLLLFLGCSGISIRGEVAIFTYYIVYFLEEKSLRKFSVIKNVATPENGSFFCPNFPSVLQQIGLLLIYRSNLLLIPGALPKHYYTHLCKNCFVPLLACSYCSSKAHSSRLPSCLKPTPIHSRMISVRSIVK